MDVHRGMVARQGRRLRRDALRAEVPRLTRTTPDPAAPVTTRGFVEREIHAVTARYGDIAHVMSTYAAGVPGAEAQPAGVNSMQLVFDGRRWWMVSVIWDEIPGAGPIPQKYMP